MIKILKKGKIPVKTKTIFKMTCEHCDCEFEFEMEDCNYVSKNMGMREYSINCPCCKANIYGNDIYALACRNEKVYKED